MSDGEWVGYDDIETVCAKLQFAQNLGKSERTTEPVGGFPKLHLTKSNGHGHSSPENQRKKGRFRTWKPSFAASMLNFGFKHQGLIGNNRFLLGTITRTAASPLDLNSSRASQSWPSLAFGT